jgi:hypothetical protein
MRKQQISEQANLAMSLIDSLGRDGAIHVCRANGWDGVLAHLLGPDRQRSRDPADGPRFRG